MDTIRVFFPKIRAVLFDFQKRAGKASLSSTSPLSYVSTWAFTWIAEVYLETSQTSKMELLRKYLTALTLNGQCSSHIETSQLICRANQFTGFYMTETLTVKALSAVMPIIILHNQYLVT